MPTFSLLKIILPKLNWKTIEILDFGGNRGNLLISSQREIIEKKYTCIDVDKEALSQGIKDFPNANWIHSNKYNPAYNPTGDKSSKELKLSTYDLIVSYSVFTHIKESEMVSTIDSLFDNHLNLNGIIIFTFLEPHACSWFIDKRVNAGAKINKSSSLAWTKNKEKYLMINDNQYEENTNYYPEACEHYLSFYKKDYLISLFDQYSPTYYPPIDDFQQSFIVIKKRSVINNDKNDRIV